MNILRLLKRPYANIRIIVGEKPDYKLANTNRIEDFYYHPQEPNDWVHTLNPGRLLPADCKMPVNLDDESILNHVIHEVSKINTDKIISISQADGFDFVGDSETLIRFVNNVASRFPNKKFSTLAYIKTQKPPQIKPLINVQIIITTILVPKDKPIEIGDRGEAIEFREDLRGWLRLTKNIVIWDYYSNFRHLLLPYPVLRAMCANFKWYASLGVNNFIVQTNAGVGHEFSELKNFLISELMYNPLQNANKLIYKFCESYYEGASDSIIRYIDALERFQRFSEKGKWLSNWGDPVEYMYSFLSSSAMKTYESFLNDAINCAKHDHALLLKVYTVYLQYLYARIELNMANKYDYVLFNYICKEIGNVTINEFNLSYIDYLKSKNYDKN